MTFTKFTCPKCGGDHFGRDIARDKSGAIVILTTVRCHAGGCGWRGEWLTQRELISRPCMLAVCSFCKRFLGFRPVERGDKADGQLTHGICPACEEKLTPVEI